MARAACRWGRWSGEERLLGGDTEGQGNTVSPPETHTQLLPSFLHSFWAIADWYLHKWALDRLPHWDKNGDGADFFFGTVISLCNLSEWGRGVSFESL